MGFNIDQDFSIFNDFLKAHPHYKAAVLRRDLQSYFIPFVEKLITIRKQRGSKDGLIVGISAIQGAGKTTQGEILETLLSHLGYSSCSLSIDDHYVTHEDLVALRKDDPRFVRRGVTHDISLAVKDLTRLKTMRENEPIVVAGYDKGAHHGDGDRFRWVSPVTDLVMAADITEKVSVINKHTQAVKVLHLTSATYDGKTFELPIDMGVDLPITTDFLPASLCTFLESLSAVSIHTFDDDIVLYGEGEKSVTVSRSAFPKGWRLVVKKPAFIFYDGWMLGAFPITDESVFDGTLPGLESEDAKEWAKTMNIRLGLYEPLWKMIDFLTILYVPNYHMSLLWREQAEQSLRANGKGMSSEEIQEFVHYFWRSVHPAVHIKNLAHDSDGTHQVVIIDDDRTIKEVLTPKAAKAKYA